MRGAEANPDIPHELRASTFHPPTLDKLDTLGLAAPLIAQGLKTPDWQIRWHETASTRCSTLPSWPARRRIPTGCRRSSRSCASSSSAPPPAIPGSAPKSRKSTQDADGVTLWGPALPAAARGAGWSAATAPAAWCGKQPTSASTGDIYPETTLLGTTQFPLETLFADLSNVNYIWTSSPAFDGTFSLLRVPRPLAPQPLPRAGRDCGGGDAAGGAGRKSWPPSTPVPPEAVVNEVRPYRVHKRLAATYRAGRLLLAGDAAHLNSPSGRHGDEWRRARRLRTG